MPSRRYDTTRALPTGLPATGLVLAIHALVASVALALAACAALEAFGALVAHTKAGHGARSHDLAAAAGLRRAHPHVARGPVQQYS